MESNAEYIETICQYVASKHKVRENIHHYIDSDRAGKRRVKNSIIKTETKNLNKRQKDLMKKIVEMVIDGATKDFIEEVNNKNGEK